MSKLATELNVIDVLKSEVFAIACRMTKYNLTQKDQVNFIRTVQNPGL